MRRALILMLAAALSLAIFAVWDSRFVLDGVEGEGHRSESSEETGSVDASGSTGRTIGDHEPRRERAGRRSRRVDGPSARPLVEVDRRLRLALSRFVEANLFSSSAFRASGVQLLPAAPDTPSIHHVLRGDIDALVCVGKVSAARGGVRRILLGEYVVAAAVHPGNPLRSVTRPQLRGLFDGMTPNWNRLGTLAAPVRVHGLERGGFEATVLRRIDLLSRGGAKRKEHADLEGVARGLRRDPGGVALLPVAIARRHGLEVLAIDGFRPPAAGTRGTLAYPFTLPIVLIIGARAQRRATSLVEQLQGALHLHARDRSVDVRRTPRRPGRTRNG